jgi:hypothetical protein
MSRCLCGFWNLGSESGVGPIQGGALCQWKKAFDLLLPEKHLMLNTLGIKSQTTQLHLHNHVDNIALEKSNVKCFTRKIPSHKQRREMSFQSRL